MRMFLCRGALVCFVMLAASLNAPGAQLQSVSTPDREALAAVVKELDAAWNERDASRLSAVFTEDASFHFPFDGLALHGREEIRRHFAGQFAASPPGLRHVTTTGEPDLIGSGLLAVDFEIDILGTDPTTGRTSAPLVHYRGLGLGLRENSGWHIRLARLYQAIK